MLTPYNLRVWRHLAQYHVKYQSKQYRRFKVNASTDSSEILNYRPTLPNAGLMSTLEASAQGEDGRVRNLHIAEERPLAIFIFQVRGCADFFFRI